VKIKAACCIFCSLALSAFCLLSCNSNYTVGKKKGYFKIDLPEKKYQLFDQPGYPYKFEYPVYARVIKDTTFFEAKPENPWWVNIDFAQFAARIHLSYKEIGKNKFDSLVNDAFKLSYKQHTYIATGIEPEELITANNIHGIYFTLSGNTATANQFFLTDSTRHFLRGALYFEAAPNADSLSIVNDFLKKDLLHLINTLQWKPQPAGK
jgi:gliding motility-associated lipoprotein GldD